MAKARRAVRERRERHAHRNPGAERSTRRPGAPLVTCGVYTTLAACEASTHFGENTEMVTAASDIQNGIITYDATTAAACIAALPTECNAIQEDFLDSSHFIPMSEMNLYTVTPACAGVFTGHSTDICHFQWECPPGTGCSDQDYCAAGTCCSGTCTALTPPTGPNGRSARWFVPGRKS